MLSFYNFIAGKLNHFVEKYIGILISKSSNEVISLFSSHSFLSLFKFYLRLSIDLNLSIPAI